MAIVKSCLWLVTLRLFEFFGLPRWLATTIGTKEDNQGIFSYTQDDSNFGDYFLGFGAFLALGVFVLIVVVGISDISKLLVAKTLRWRSRIWLSVM